jgi:hypothetical protein
MGFRDKIFITEGPAASSCTAQTRRTFQSRPQSPFPAIVTVDAKSIRTVYHSRTKVFNDIKGFIYKHKTTEKVF